MADFPHLKLPFKVEGRAKPFKGGGKRNPQAEAITNTNKANRQNHGQYLGNSANTLVDNWNELKELKKAEAIEFPNENDIPVFLKAFPVNLQHSTSVGLKEIKVIKMPLLVQYLH